MQRAKVRMSAIFHWFLAASLTKKGIVVLIIGGILFGGYTLTLGKKPTVPQYQTSQVRRGDIISTLTESGNITSGTETNVTSPTSGIITAISVKNGDVVSAGENLFSVKSTATQQEQEQAYANFLAAQNTLNAAKSKMNSLQSALFKANQAFVKDAGTPNPDTADPKYIEENADWLQAQADYINQQGVISQAAAALSAAGLAYQQTQDSIVTAPVDGTVANFSAVVGSNISGGGNATSNTTSTTTSSNASGSTVLIIGNFANLRIKTPVSEVDAPNVHVGQKATVTLDAFPNKTFVGRVDSIDTIGTNSSGVVTYSAYITLISPPSDVLPGMTASAVIQLDRHDTVLLVPTTAVQTRNGASFVRVLKHGEVTQVPVETGLSSDTDTEITSGLSEGDTVVTSTITPTSGNNAAGGSPFSGTRGIRGFGGGFGGGRGAGGAGKGG